MNPITLTIRRAAWPRVAVSWSVNQLLAWLNEVEPIADQRGKFDWLEIPPIASSTAIQEAYHQIARTRHPDLFRSRIDVRTMDRLVRMYARVTSAYADLKEPEKCGAYLRDLRGPRVPTNPPPDVLRAKPAAIAAAPAPPASAGPPAPPTAAAGSGTTSERPTTRIARQAAPGELDPAHAMNARALSFYRRAEGALKTGDRSAALLQLKMAIAADPKSQFLRAALLELTRS